MRKAIILTLLSTTGAGSVGAMSSLDALSMIESGDNDHAIGSAGEVSRFQIRPHIWRHYSQDSNYRNSRTARAIAGRFLSDLEADFRKRSGRAPSDFDRYVLWNAGATYYARIGFSQARVAKTIRERATRYANLCHLPDSSNETPVIAAAPTKAPAVSQTRVTQPAGKLPAITAASQVISRPPDAESQLEFPVFSAQLIPPSPAAVGPVPPPRPQQGVLALGGIGLP